MVVHLFSQFLKMYTYRIIVLERVKTTNLSKEIKLKKLCEGLKTILTVHKYCLKFKKNLASTTLIQIIPVS